jgi:hypothetical protein
MAKEKIDYRNIHSWIMALIEARNRLHEIEFHRRKGLGKKEEIERAKEHINKHEIYLLSELKKLK